MSTNSRLKKQIDELETIEASVIRNRENLPKALKKAAKRALEKIEREIYKTKKTSREDGELIQEPYMGVLETEKTHHEEPVSLFASNVRCHQVISLSVYRALKNTQTGEIQKDTLIHQIHMSEKQFANIMARPNAQNDEAVTQTVRLGEGVKTQYDPELDVFKTYEREGQSTHVKNQLSDIRQALAATRDKLDQAQKEKGRIGKKELERDASNIAATTVNIDSNIAFHQTEYAREMIRKINEGAIIAHMDIQSQKNKGGGSS